MKVLCCGDRNWPNEARIRRVLEAHGLGPGDVVVHGNSGLADWGAGICARDMGCDVVAVSAEWERHGRAAGPIRNQRMLDEHPDIDLVIAFHSRIDASKGTKDMIRRAHDKGIPVQLEE